MSLILAQSVSPPIATAAEEVLTALHAAVPNPWASPDLAEHSHGLTIYLPGLFEPAEENPDPAYNDTLAFVHDTQWPDFLARLRQDETRVSLSASPNVAVAGQQVTFTATVSPVLPGQPEPTGTVTFWDDGTSLGTATLDADGAATFSTTLVSGAMISGGDVVAKYAGDGADFTASTGSLMQWVLDPGMSTLWQGQGDGNWDSDNWGAAGQRPADWAGAVVNTAGTVTVDSEQTAGWLGVSDGGRVTIAAGGSLATGNVVLGSGGMVSVLAGGTLTAPLFDETDNSASLYLDGGTWQADTTGSIPVPVNLGPGGSTIDPDGDSPTLAGAITGPGGMTISGTGTVSFFGSNSYTGGTAVQSGTLDALGSQAAPSGTLLSIGPNGSIVFGTPGTTEPVQQATIATITAVSSPVAADTWLRTGATIPITLTFSDPVTVDTTRGTPQLALNVNAGAIAVYSSGSGTGTLTFDYIVAAGDAASPLDYASTSALILHGGTIKGTAGGVADLTLPAISTDGLATQSITIDTGVPTVTAVSLFGNRRHLVDAGATIPIAIAWSQPVTVDTTGGTPQLALNAGATARALYAGGSGTSTLTFNYIVAAGDAASPLDYTSIFALILNGGTIEDTAGDAANLVLPVTGTDGLATLDITVAPAVKDISASARRWQLVRAALRSRSRSRSRSRLPWTRRGARRSWR